MLFRSSLVAQHVPLTTFERRRVLVGVVLIQLGATAGLVQKYLAQLYNIQSSFLPNEPFPSPLPFSVDSCTVPCLVEISALYCPMWLKVV